MKTLLVLLLLSLNVLAQDWKIDRKIDPTWLHRYVPSLSETRADLASPTCHFKAIFGQGDADDRTLQSVARFAEVTLDAHGNCQTTLYDREEEIYFVLRGKADLHYGDQTYAMRPNDFTYLPPSLKHSIANTSDQPVQVLVMSFKVPARITINAPSLRPKIVNHGRRKGRDG